MKHDKERKKGGNNTGANSKKKATKNDLYVKLAWKSLMCGGGEGGRGKKKKKEEGVRPLQPLRSPDGGLSKHHNTGAGGSGGEGEGRGDEKRKDVGVGSK